MKLRHFNPLLHRYSFLRLLQQTFKNVAKEGAVSPAGAISSFATMFSKPSAEWTLKFFLNVVCCKIAVWRNGLSLNFVYTQYILLDCVGSCKINTVRSIPRTNQYWAMTVKFLAQGNNGLPMTGFEPMRPSILRSFHSCIVFHYCSCTFSVMLAQTF